MEAVSVGTSRKAAAALAGIEPRDLRKWLQRTGEPYVSLRREIQKAEAQHERRLVLSLVSKARDESDVARWLLQRSPSTRARWDARPSTIVPPANFNLSLVLDQVAERRRQRALAAPNQPTPSGLNGRVIDVVATRPETL